MLSMLVAMTFAASPLEIQWGVSLGTQWAQEGPVATWSVSSTNDPAANDVKFQIVTDAEGRLLHLFRSGAHDPGIVENGVQGGPLEPAQIPWAEPEWQALWARAEPVAAMEAWEGKHKYMTTPRVEYADVTKPVDVKGGKERLAFRVLPTVKRGKCQGVALEVTFGKTKGIFHEDACLKGEETFNQIMPRVTVSWSADGSRAAFDWVVHRESAEEEGARTYIGLVTKRTLARVDLLDAGGGAALDELEAKLTAEGFRVVHRAKATTARKETEVYYAPGFEEQARDVAKVAGAKAVKPLSWKTPYAVTVAVGGD